MRRPPYRAHRLMTRLLAELGPWLWMAASLVLLTAHALFAGRALFAAGLAALLTGSLALTAQFSVLALGAALQVLLCGGLFAALMWVIARQFKS